VGSKKTLEPALDAVQKPYLSLHDKEAKPFMGLEVGAVVSFEVKAKLTRKTKSEDSDNRKDYSASFDIEDIVFEPSTEKKLEGKSF